MLGDEMSVHQGSPGNNKMLGLMPRWFLKIENVGVSVEQLLSVPNGRDLTINADKW